MKKTEWLKINLTLELKFEKLYLDHLPSAELYEKSFMHRDVVTHVLVAKKTEFIITASWDGHVKFWKKQPTGIEFVKHFRSHLGKSIASSFSLKL
jgi:peptidylprolyl isomerase domain and WD repeat-containing protein 1